MGGHCFMPLHFLDFWPIQSHCADTFRHIPRKDYILLEYQNFFAQTSHHADIPRHISYTPYMSLDPRYKRHF